VVGSLLKHRNLMGNPVSFIIKKNNIHDFINNHQPSTVIVAEGSPVTVNWKRISF
jgi:hypothetical protein